MILEITDLIHHLLIDGKTTGSIDDNHVIAIGLCLLDSMVGNNTYILIIRLTIYRNTNLFTHNMELLDSSRTVNVAGNEQWLLTFLCLEHIGKLAAECSFTRTLKTAHEDDGRMTFELQWSLFSTHEFCKFIMNQLHHQLTRLHCCQHIHTERLFLHLVGKFLCHFIVDIGIEECTAHILHSLSYIDFGNLTFTLQDFEGTF